MRAVARTCGTGDRFEAVPRVTKVVAIKAAWAAANSVD